MRLVHHLFSPDTYALMTGLSNNLTQKKQTVSCKPSVIYVQSSVNLCVRSSNLVRRNTESVDAFSPLQSRAGWPSLHRLLYINITHGNFQKHLIWHFSKDTPKIRGVQTDAFWVSLDPQFDFQYRIFSINKMLGNYPWMYAPKAVKSGCFCWKPPQFSWKRVEKKLRFRADCEVQTQLSTFYYSLKIEKPPNDPNLSLQRHLSWWNLTIWTIYKWSQNK